jgi:hypothetical protein
MDAIIDFEIEKGVVVVSAYKIPKQAVVVSTGTRGATVEYWRGSGIAVKWTDPNCPL